MQGYVGLFDVFYGAPDTVEEGTQWRLFPFILSTYHGVMGEKGDIQGKVKGGGR